MAAETVPERDYYDAFRQRLRAARDRLDYSQDQMATALGMTLDNYKKYERRSKFPLHKIELLALVTHSDVAFWVTGRNVRQLTRRTTG